MFSPWIMHMRWTDLLFMHWPLPSAAIRDMVPAGLEIDTFEGQAWLGIVPFRMSNVRPRGLPPMGPLSAFPELNVRTYVKHRGRGGVWFFSLDAASKLAVRAARFAFHLPYFDARMSVTFHDGQVQYDSLRTHKRAAPAHLRMRYRPTGPATVTRPGTLDDFLTNRLCLFAANRRGQIYCGDIDHAPWPLQPAEAEIETNTMTGQIGVKLPDVPPLLHYARRLDVVAWRLRGV
jgi:uncharacterized protein YqjF (DUF2071 family)